MKEKTTNQLTVVLLVIGAAILLMSANGMIGGGNEKEDYPAIAYVNDTSYYYSGKICEAVPKRMPDGKIETFVDLEIMPDAPDSANFGAEYGSMEYMILETGELIIQMEGDWYVFEQK